jgi:hypothetical protein
MKIQTKLLKERKDGSAICELDLDKEAKDWLIGEGFVSVLSKALDMSESVVKKQPKRIRQLVEDLDMDGRC